MYLLTRPLAQSLILQNDLKTLGIESFIEPMIAIEEIIAKPIKIANDSLVIITSSNILEILLKHQIDRLVRIAMVGDESSKIAQSLGFNNIIKVAKNIEELIDFIRYEIPSYTEINYLRSEYIAFDLKNHLKSFGYFVVEYILYKSIPSKKLSDGLVLMIKNHEIKRVLFFSKRTSAIFISLAKNAGILSELSGIEALVMSNNIANQLKNINWKKVIIAKHPTKSAMIGII